jgi:hypothetical protein
MALPVWGNLEKSQIDAEKIEEAIARLISEHCDDETAHLGAGQSLQSHKASEIIDHLAESIVADKIKTFNVPVEALTLNKQLFRPTFETLDAWAFAGDGSYYSEPGILKLQTQAVINSVEVASVTGSVGGINFYYGNPVFETLIFINFTSNISCRFGIGEPFQDFIGFWFENGHLYVESYFSGYGTDNEVDIPVFTGAHLFRAVYTSLEKIEFYIDDVLVYTETMYLPSNPNVYDMLYFAVTTKSAQAKVFEISGLSFFQDRRY